MTKYHDIPGLSPGLDQTRQKAILLQIQLDEVQKKARQRAFGKLISNLLAVIFLIAIIGSVGYYLYSNTNEMMAYVDKGGQWLNSVIDNTSPAIQKTPSPTNSEPGCENLTVSDNGGKVNIPPVVVGQCYQITDTATWNKVFSNQTNLTNFADHINQEQPEISVPEAQNRISNSLINGVFDLRLSGPTPTTVP